MRFLQKQACCVLGPVAPPDCSFVDLFLKILRPRISTATKAFVSIQQPTHAPLNLFITFYFLSRLMHHVIFSKGDNPNTSLKVL